MEHERLKTWNFCFQWSTAKLASGASGRSATCRAASALRFEPAKSWGQSRTEETSAQCLKRHRPATLPSAQNDISTKFQLLEVKDNFIFKPKIISNIDIVCLCRMLDLDSVQLIGRQRLGLMDKVLIVVWEFFLLKESIELNIVYYVTIILFYQKLQCYFLANLPRNGTTASTTFGQTWSPTEKKRDSSKLKS